ncbi:MAG: ASPIC/UnbV domain-containing protein, partial [Phycisphaerae bacterium]
QEIGIGKADRVTKIDVTWPASGEKQTFEDVPINCAYEIREDIPELRSLPMRSFSLGGAAGDE